MKYPIFSIKDNLIGFGTTFTAVSNEVAIRGFVNSVKYNDTPDYCPEDLVLFRVGEFDTDSGVIESCVPDAIAFGHEIVSMNL